MAHTKVGDYKACKDSWNKNMDPGFFDTVKVVMEAFNTGGYCARAKPSPTTGAQTPSGCPKCATFKKTGKTSCCAPGGAWSNDCGGPGDSKFGHTWAEGINACKGKLVCD